MDATRQAAQVDEMWVLGAPPSRRRATASPAMPTHHVRDLALAVSAAVLLALGAGVALTGGLMSADGDGSTVVGTVEP